MTSQGLFAGEFPADVLPTQLRELLKEAAPALLDGLFEDLRAIESALSGGDGAAPTCTAEELIWHLLLQEAIVTYESQELSADRRSDLADYVARFEDFIYQDTDWRLLYDHSEAEREAAANTSPAVQDIIQPVEFWFKSFYGVPAHPDPYCRD
jgi:hypothetical protein